MQFLHVDRLRYQAVCKTWYMLQASTVVLKILKCIVLQPQSYSPTNTSVVFSYVTEHRNPQGRYSSKGVLPSIWNDFNLMLNILMI